MKAITDRVLIMLDEQNDGNLLIPETIERPQTTGIVISVGNKVKDIQKGDHVVFHAFDEVPCLENRVVAVRDKSILAILEE